MRRLLVLILTLILILSCFTTVAMEKRNYVIGISMATQNSTYWEAMMISVSKTCEELGNVEVRYLVAEDDANIQNQQIDTFISQNVDAVICVPYDSEAILMSVEACHEAGIPFIWCDRKVAGSETIQADYGAGTDNYALTRNGAEWLVEMARSEGIVLKAIEFVGALTDENAILRSKAFNDVAIENPSILSIVTSVPTNWDMSVPYSALKNAISANPEINCILAATDGFWPACVNALVELGLYAKTGETNHVYFIGLDGEPYAIRALEQGYIDGDMCQPIMAAARACIYAAIVLADGGIPENQFDLLAGETITQANFEQIAYTAYGYTSRMEYDYDKYK